MEEVVKAELRLGEPGFGPRCRGRLRTDGEVSSGETASLGECVGVVEPDASLPRFGDGFVSARLAEGGEPKREFEVESDS